MSQYETKNRDKLLNADNQQGSQRKVDPSTTKRTAPQKQWKTKDCKGYQYDAELNRWTRIVTDKEAYCVGCGMFKKLVKFANVKNKPHHYCKWCVRLRKAASRYGISTERAANLYTQKYCDCCGCEFEKEVHKHIHHLGTTVRGIVCIHCNHMLRDESPGHLRRLKCCVKFIEQGEDIV